MWSLSVHLNCYKKNSSFFHLIQEWDKKSQKWLLQKQKSSQDRWHWY